MPSFTPADRSHCWIVRSADSARVIVYRVGALALGLVWPMWIAQLALTRTGPDGIFDHLYIATTFLLFCSAEVLLLVAWAFGREQFLTVALRYCGVVLVIALLLLAFDPYTGSVDGVDCLWFSGMTGVPAVAVALTVSPRLADAYFIPVVGSGGLAESFIGGERSVVELIGTVGFAFIYSYYFVVVASTLTLLVGVIDNTVHRVHEEQRRAASLQRLCLEEDTNIRGLLRVALDGLGEIARRSRTTRYRRGVSDIPDFARHPTITTECAGSAPEDPSLREATGFDRVFSWPYLSICTVILVFQMCSSASPTSVAAIVTCGLLIGSLALLWTSQWDELPLARALIIAGALCVVAVVGQWQDPGDGRENPLHWEFGVLSLVGALLITRGRVLAGVSGVLGGITVLAFVQLAGLVPDGAGKALSLALGSIVVFAAVLLRWAVDHFVGQVPGVQRDYRVAFREAEAVAEAVDARRASRESLISDVGPVFEAAARVTTISPALARRAELMRLQVMDGVNAPCLMVPALREAVWDARGRGVTVTFVDDRVNAPGSAEVPLTESQTASLLARYLPLIDNAEEGSVTVLYPV